MSIAHIVAAKAAEAVAGSLIKAGISHFRNIKEGKHEFHGDLKSIAADFGMSDRLEAINKILPDKNKDPADKLSDEGRAAFLKARNRLVAMGGRVKEKAEGMTPVSAEAGKKLADFYRRADELVGRAADAGGIDRRALIQGAVDTVHEMKARVEALAQNGINAKPFVHASNFLDENINALIAREREPRLTLNDVHEQSARIAIDEEISAATPASSTPRNKT